MNRNDLIEASNLLERARILIHEGKEPGLDNVLADIERDIDQLGEILDKAAVCDEGENGLPVACGDIIYYFSNDNKLRRGLVTAVAVTLEGHIYVLCGNREYAIGGGAYLSREDAERKKQYETVDINSLKLPVKPGATIYVLDSDETEVCEEKVTYVRFEAEGDVIIGAEGECWEIEHVLGGESGDDLFFMTEREADDYLERLKWRHW